MAKSTRTYQIPVADRQRLLDLQAEQARLEDEEDDLELALNQGAAAKARTAATLPGNQPASRCRYRTMGACRSAKTAEVRAGTHTPCC